MSGGRPRVRKETQSSGSESGAARTRENRRPSMRHRCRRARRRRTSRMPDASCVGRAGRRCFRWRPCWMRRFSSLAPRCASDGPVRVARRLQRRPGPGAAGNWPLSACVCRAATGARPTSIDAVAESGAPAPGPARKTGIEAPQALRNKLEGPPPCPDNRSA